MLTRYGCVSFGIWILLFSRQIQMWGCRIPTYTFFKRSPLPRNHFAKPRIIFGIFKASDLFKNIGIVVDIHWVTYIMPTFGISNGILFHEFNRSPAIPCNIFKYNFFRCITHKFCVRQLPCHQRTCISNQT
jgi:hypothetical protein